jgi:hypothetical protein
MGWQAPLGGFADLSEVTNAAIHILFRQIHRRARLARRLTEPSLVFGPRPELIEALRDLIVCALSALPRDQPHRSWLVAQTGLTDGGAMASIRVELTAGTERLRAYDSPSRASAIASKHGGIVRIVRETARAVRFEIELPIEPRPPEGSPVTGVT